MGVEERHGNGGRRGAKEFQLSLFRERAEHLSAIHHPTLPVRRPDSMRATKPPKKRGQALLF
ncbi:hypothetical protein EYF80_029046 [Liparis tanakae]|uniref:Uncharacterized protein n=1 Tax=Liparis tanakae TaxID=230148 RepID=A0A4Z2H7A4_9TELE|nr:hypothetical protein EYF80_029046 [Liparis tanakae]